MQPLGLSQSRLARDLDIPQSRLSAISRGERAITADTALRLAEYFGTSARFWLNLGIRPAPAGTRRRRAHPPPRGKEMIPR